MKSSTPRPGTLDASVGSYVVQLRRDLLRIAAGSRPLWLTGWAEAPTSPNEDERRVWVQAADQLAAQWESWRATTPRTTLVAKVDLVPLPMQAGALEGILARTLEGLRLEGDRAAVGLRYTYRAVESVLHQALDRRPGARDRGRAPRTA